MTVREYVGARYVPLFADPLEWDSTKTYEPLTVVYYQGNSYTSRQAVPSGIDINNDQYWALTGNYNAQIEQYRTEVRTFDERITANSDAIGAFNTELGEFENSTNEAIATERLARENADNNIKGLIGNGFTSESTITSAIENLESELENKLQIPNAINFMKPIYRQEMVNRVNVNGGCIYKRGNIKYFIYAFTEQNDTLPTVIYMTSENGNIIASLETSLVGHAQNMCVYNDKLYVANTHLTDIQAAGTTGLAVFNLDATSITYDTTINCPFVDYVFEFTIIGDYIYMRNRNSLDKRRMSDFGLVNSTTLSELGLINFGNGFIPFELKNVIGIMSIQSNSITFVNCDTMEIEQKTKISPSYGYIDMFEWEWGAFDGSTLYLGNNSGYNYSGGGVSDISIFTILETDIFKQYGFSDSSNCNAIADQYINQRININLDYVNGDKIPNMPDGFSPTITLKYPQDVKGLIKTWGTQQEYVIALQSDCPICIKLEGVICAINCNSNRVKGIFLYGCNASLVDSAGASTKTTDASYWIRNDYLVYTDFCPRLFTSLYWVLSGATTEYNLHYTTFIASNQNILNLINAKEGSYLALSN